MRISRHLRATRSRGAVGRLLALGLAVTGVALLPVAPAFADDPVAGALTSGDSLFPNQGNGGYDALHYDIGLKVNVAVSSTHNAVATTTFPEATASIQAQTTGAPLSSYAFDFQGSTGNLAASTLNVDSVTVDGVPASFSRIENTTTNNATTDVHKLVVTPATPVSGAFTTVVRYSGTPVRHVDTDGSSEGWNNTTDGATFLNQPVGSMTAFPNNNTPSDKATYTFSIEAPTTLTTSNLAAGGGTPHAAAAVSNGELVSRTASGDGSRTTWVWDQQKPMASELTLISIGRYDMYESQIPLASGRVLPEWSFIDPAISVANQTTTLSTRAQLKSLIDFLETKYGPYPGNSTGLVTDVVPSSINYALETQDRSFFPNSASRGTTYHEVMHQWFGDNVAPVDWNDIWLNEGPATYAETQFPYEGAGSSTNSSETSLFNTWNGTPAGNSLWTTPTAAMTQASQLFGAQVYTRGAMTLAALRTAIGDADFETLMRQWQVQYGGTSRRTSAFIALAQSISGRDLTAFFQSWIYTSGRPAWPAKFTLNLAGPAAPVAPGDPVSYVLSSRNTGKVAQTGSVVTVDLADVVDDATLGALPANTTLDGTTLTWTVPSTGVGATSTVTIPATVNAATDGRTLRAVARATTLGSTCVECAPSVVVGAAPISPAPAPTITGGAPTVAAPLAADTTGWADGTTFAYQWLADGIPVPGATAATYTPDVTAVGLPISVVVTGTLTGFATTRSTSAPTAIVVRAAMTSPVPTIAGTLEAGKPLTVDPGTWTPGTVFTYQWRNGGTAIGGATGPTFTPSQGQTISVTVTGTKAGYTTASQTSATTGAVPAGTPLASTPTPTFTGAPKVAVVFQPTIGTWDDGTTLTFQWAANGTNVTGAAGTGPTLTPTATQQGQTLVLTVTGTKPGLPAVVRTSAASSAVEPGTQTLQPTPTITGTPRPGTAVTGVQGTWDTGTTRTNQWSVDGVPVGGATTTTFTPTVDQIGKALTFTVTSTRTGYTTVVKTSAATTILGYAQTLTPTPTISGTPKVDQVLTANPGTWDDGTTLSYQWLADSQPIDGATGSTYTPGPGRVGAVISVVVTSTKDTYETVTKTSDATAAVAVGDLSTTPTPTISGTPKVDVQLTAVPGTWDDGVTLAYQWAVAGTPVDGATGTTFLPRPADAGKTVTVAVTGSKTGYTSTTRTSDPTAAVADGDLTSTPTPTVTGTPKVGEPLSVSPGVWDDAVTLAYQWSVDGTPVDGATGTTFTPRAADVGKTVTVAATGSKTGYTSVTRTSDATAAVAEGDPTSTPTPGITGTPKVDVVLTAVPGTWDDGVTLTYQWAVDGTPVDGATGTTFTPRPADAGKTVTVAVTGTRPGYSSVTRTSDPTAFVALGDQTATPTPTVTGTPKVAVALTAVPGSWDDGVTLAYQWSVDGNPVDGATGTTFTPRPADVGETVTVAVTGTRTGYSPVTRTSDATAAVALGNQTATPTPTVTGTPQVGVSLTAVPGSWDDGVTLTYQWSVAGTDVVDADDPTFTPRPEDLGEAVTVDVTGTKPGYDSETRTSDATAEVALGTLDGTPEPQLTGMQRVGRTLRVLPGAFGGGIAIQWLRGATPIPGRSADTYTLAAADAGQLITARVTYSRTGYTSVVEQVTTDLVLRGVMTRRPVPRISGPARVGQLLTAVPGAHDAGVTVRYQWLANGQTVRGASGRTFRIPARFRGDRIRVRTIASKPGYYTVTRVSAATAKVV